MVTAFKWDCCTPPLPENPAFLILLLGELAETDVLASMYFKLWPGDATDYKYSGSGAGVLPAYLLAVVGCVKAEIFSHLILQTSQ